MFFLLASQGWTQGAFAEPESTLLFGGTSLRVTVVVVEVASGVGKTIADGTNPSWSPTGDWIAYTDGNRQKCMLIHPDGTGVKIVRDLSKEYRKGYWLFHYGPVWSPDGGKLLLNEYELDVPGALIVTLLDLATDKVTTESKHGMVYTGGRKIAGESHNRRRVKRTMT